MFASLGLIGWSSSGVGLVRAALDAPAMQGLGESAFLLEQMERRTHGCTVGY